MATSVGPRWLSLNSEDLSASILHPQMFSGALAGAPGASSSHFKLSEGISFNSTNTNALPSNSSPNPVQVTHPARLLGISNSPMCVFRSFSTPAEPSVFAGTVLQGKVHSTSVIPSSPQSHIIDSPKNGFILNTRGYPVSSPFDSTLLAAAAAAPTKREIHRRISSVADLGSDQSSLDDACVPATLAPRGLPRNLSLETTCSMGNLAQMLPVILRSTPVSERPQTVLPLMAGMVPAQAIGTDATAAHAANEAETIAAAKAATVEANRAADAAAAAAAVCRVESLDVTTVVEDDRDIDIDFLLASFEDPSAGSLPEFEGDVNFNATAKDGFEDFDLDGVDLKALFDSFANDDGEGDAGAELCSPLTGGGGGGGCASSLEAVFSGVPIPLTNKGDVTPPRGASSPCNGAIGGERSLKRRKRNRREPTALQPTTPDQQVPGGFSRPLFNTGYLRIKKTRLAGEEKMLDAQLPPVGSPFESCVPTQCSYLFTKCLTQSDITRFGRIILPRANVEAHFPLCPDREGVPLELFTSEGHCFPCALKFWLNGPRPNPKRMYLLESCSALIAAFGLVAGDYLEFYRAPDGRIVLDVHASA